MDLQGREPLRPGAGVASLVANDHPACWDVHPRRQRGCRTDHAESVLPERLLDDRPVVRPQPGVVEGDPPRARLREPSPLFGRPGLAELLRDHRGLLPDVGRLGHPFVGECARELFCLAARPDERHRLPAVTHRGGDQRCRRGRVVVRLGRLVDGHRLCRLIVERHGPVGVHARPEVDRAPLRLHQPGIEPRRDRAGVVDCRRQRHHLWVCRPTPECRECHLQGGAPTGRPEEVDLVDDDTRQRLDPRRTVADRRVHLLGGGDDHVLVGQLGGRRVVVAGRDPDTHARQLGELLVLLAGQRPQRTDVQPRPVGRQHRQLRDERLPGGGRHCTHQVLPVTHPRLDGRGLGRVQFVDPTRLEVVAVPRGQREFPHTHTSCGAASYKNPGSDPSTPSDRVLRAAASGTSIRLPNQQCDDGDRRDGGVGLVVLGWERLLVGVTPRVGGGVARRATPHRPPGRRLVHVPRSGDPTGGVGRRECRDSVDRGRPRRLRGGVGDGRRESG